MSETIRIRHLTNNDTDLIPLWDQEIRECNLPPHALYAWKNILEDVYKAKTYALLALNGESKLMGYALLFKPKGEEALYSCRYGFWAATKEAANALCEEIKSIAAKHKVQKALVTSGEFPLDLPDKEKSKESLFLPLIYADEEQLWQSIPKKTKNMIRKAEKSGLSLTYDWGYLPEFYEIYAQRFIEKGLHIQPIEHFQAVRDLFGSDAVFIGALQEGKLVAGMIFLSAGKTVSYAYNASIVSASNNGANNLIMWDAMQYFYRKGAQYVDLSESTPDSPVYKFKTHLSKDIQIREIYYYDALSGQKFAGASFSHFIRNKVRGAMHRLMPLMPPRLKRKYLTNLGTRGRII